MDIPIYLPTTKVSVQTFFWKKYGWRIPYLPTVWTYVQNFVVFFYWTLSLLRCSILTSNALFIDSTFSSKISSLFLSCLHFVHAPHGSSGFFLTFFCFNSGWKNEKLFHLVGNLHLSPFAQLFGFWKCITCLLLPFKHHTSL